MALIRPFLHFTFTKFPPVGDVQCAATSAWVTSKAKILSADCIRRAFCDAWQRFDGSPQFKYNDYRHLSQIMFQRYVAIQSMIHEPCALLARDGSPNVLYLQVRDLGKPAVV